MNSNLSTRYELFSQGIFIDPMVDKKRLVELARKLRPYKTDIDLIRLGANSDGGYLIPNDLNGIGACFSPGVDQIASFESDLLKLGITSHLADFSVDNVPEGFKAGSFIKKFIGPNNSDVFITLDKWISQHYELESSPDLILQMDIEGAEYASLLSTPIDILKKFRIMVVEFHDIETWSQHHFLNIVESVFEKILNEFVVVHNHPNNAMGSVNLNGFIAPRLLEITFLRKDRIGNYDGFCELPHLLDFPNLIDRPNVIFGKDWE
jgi:hypothetical protein